MIAINRLSPEWALIKAWNNDQIETNRQLLEDRHCSEEEGHFLRGTIAVLKEQIKAVEERIVTPEAEGEKDYV